MAEQNWTKEELKEFDRLSWESSSRDQVERISGRMELSAFVKKHGEEKCDAMFAFLMKKGK